MLLGVAGHGTPPAGEAPARTASPTIGPSSYRGDRALGVAPARLKGICPSPRWRLVPTSRPNGCRRTCSGRSSYSARSALQTAEPELGFPRRDHPIVEPGGSAPWIDADPDRKQQRGRAKDTGEAAVRAAQECTDERHDGGPEGATAPAAAAGERAGARAASDARAPPGTAGAPAEDPDEGVRRGAVLAPVPPPPAAAAVEPGDRTAGPGPEQDDWFAVRHLSGSRDRTPPCCPYRFAHARNKSPYVRTSLCAIMIAKG